MIYAMSDIHGHFDKLTEFFDKAKKAKLFKPGDKLIFMGDYIDGGKDSFKVINKIYALAKEYQDNIVVLRGNHEEWFLRFLDKEGNDWIGEDSHFRTSKTFLSKEQLHKLEEMRAKGNESQMLYDYIRNCMNEKHEDLIGWLRALPYYYETEKQIFVHAGIEENIPEEWKDKTSKENFIGKYPPTFGQFKKDVIAGHVAAKDVAVAYMDIKDVKEADLKYQGRIFWDKENHFYIDGGLAADDRGNLFCLAYSEENDYYRDIYFEENKLRKARIGKNKAPKGVPQNERDYGAVGRTVDIINILKEKTDESHSLTQESLYEAYKSNNVNSGNKYCGERTFYKDIAALYDKLEPEWSEDRTIKDYKIQVKGLEERLSKEKESLELDFYNDDNEFDKKLQMRELRWNHIFSFDELNKVMDAVFNMRTFDDAEKKELINKLKTLSSENFADYSPYINKNGNSINTNIQTAYRNSRVDEKLVMENLKIINQGIDNRQKLSFKFGGFDKNHQPVNQKNKDGIDRIYEVSPYYVVIYDERYYLICQAFDRTDVTFYRIDLMREIELKVEKSEDDTKVIKVPAMDKYKINDLPPIWNTEKASEFLSEHLYMFYGEPRSIRLKVKKDRFTLLQDFFGTHYDLLKFGKENDEKWQEVCVTCVPEALMNWAMQLSECVEILDKELRERMKKRCDDLFKRYGGER